MTIVSTPPTRPTVLPIIGGDSWVEKVPVSAPASDTLRLDPGVYQITCASGGDCVMAPAPQTDGAGVLLIPAGGTIWHYVEAVKEVRAWTTGAEPVLLSIAPLTTVVNNPEDVGTVPGAVSVLP